MKQSWSTKLFLQINNNIGKNKKIDKFISICAFYLIFLFAFFVFLYSFLIVYKNNLADLMSFALFLLVAFVIGMLASQITGWLWPHRRPAIENPEVKQLYKPLSSWKSFPSDHTIGSSILAVGLLVIGAPYYVWVAGFVVALYIGFSRVYAGLHYPRDIIGGVLYAIIACALSFYIVGL